MQMNFVPESGYHVALDCFSRLGLPIRDRNVPCDAETSTQLEDPSQIQHAILSAVESGSVNTRNRENNYPLLRSAQQIPQSCGISMDTRPTTTSTEASDFTIVEAPSFLLSTSMQGINHNPSTHPLESSRSIPNLVDPLSRKIERSHVDQLPPLNFVPRIHTSDGRLESNQDLADTWKVSGNTVHRESQPNSFVYSTRRTSLGRDNLEAQRTATIRRSATLDELSQILPPKRILPFPDPPRESNRHDTILKAAEPNTDITPKSEVTTVRKRNAPKRVATVKPKQACRSVAKSTAKTKTAVPSCSNPVKTPNITKTAITPDVCHKNTKALTEAKINTKSPPPFMESSTDKVNLQSNGPTAEGAKNEAQKENAVLDDNVDQEWADRVDAFIRKYGNHLPTPVPPPLPPPAPAPPAPQSPPQVSESDLIKYAELPEKERLATLDNLILDLVWDENFAVLCEDVEKSWRRIGLGF